MAQQDPEETYGRVLVTRLFLVLTRCPSPERAHQVWPMPVIESAENFPRSVTGDNVT